MQAWPATRFREQRAENNQVSITFFHVTCIFPFLMHAFSCIYFCFSFYRTVKKDCPAHIILKLSKSGKQYVIASMIDKHENHDELKVSVTNGHLQYTYTFIFLTIMFDTCFFFFRNAVNISRQLGNSTQIKKTTSEPPLR